MSLFSNIPHGECDSIRVYINGNEEIKRKHWVVVFNSDTFASGKPVERGICDSAMGTIDFRYRCSTCFNDRNNCPGHGGHIKFAIPQYQPLFFDKIIKILKQFCHKCYKILPNKTNRYCKECKYENPRIDEGPGIMNIVFKEGDVTRQMYSFEIQKILEQIPIENYKKLNDGKSIKFSPKKLVVNYMNVPTVTIRPDIKITQGAKNMNGDITVMLIKEIKINEQLPKDIEDKIKKDEKINNKAEDLTRVYHEFFRGGKSTKKDKEILTKKLNIGNINKPFTASLSFKLMTKKGYIRYNILVKY